jgi:hypothetical protein
MLSQAGASRRPSTLLVFLNLRSLTRAPSRGRLPGAGPVPAGDSSAVHALLELANQPSRVECRLHACDADAPPYAALDGGRSRLGAEYSQWLCHETDDRSGLV